MYRKPIEEIYMEIAHKIAERGTCPRRRVGCVIVKDNRIISTGYNGAPSGFEHCIDVGCLMVGDHCIRAVHAEQNAITFAAKHGISVKGAELYTTDFPCLNCARMIVNAGIKKIYYQNPYPDLLSKEFLKRSGIELRQILLKGFVFVFEGMDNSGKSTLIKEMKKMLPGLYLKIPIPNPVNLTKEEVIFKYDTLLKVMQENPEQIYYIDRFYTSEICYSYKRKYTPSLRYLKYFVDSIKSFPHLYIYCCPPKETILERLKEEGDNFMKKSDVNRLFKKYDKLYDNLPLNKIKIDTSQSIQACLKEIFAAYRDIKEGNNERDYY